MHDVLMASEVEDATALAALLHPDVVALVDSGGDRIAPTVALHGADEVIPELFAALSLRHGTVVREHRVNGAPALVGWETERVVVVVSFGVHNGLVRQVWVTTSPQKLRRWNAPVTDHPARLSELVIGDELRGRLNEGHIMNIVVMGGTGLIGSKVAALLTEHGHEAIAASPASGVNAYTGEGLRDVLQGADVVVDVTNSPSFEDAAVLDFFTTSTSNLLAAEKDAGVAHHVALSIVGTDRLPDSGYLRAKLAQEQLIEQSGVPYTIVRSTQFFEFVKGIADGATVDGVVRLPHELIQPIAGEDAAAAVARAAAGEPLNGRIEIGGPIAYPMDEFIRTGLAAQGDPRRVIAADDARYFGALLEERSLVPGEDGQLSTQTFDHWLGR